MKKNQNIFNGSGNFSRNYKYNIRRRNPGRVCTGKCNTGKHSNNRKSD